MSSLHRFPSRSDPRAHRRARRRGSRSAEPVLARPRPRQREISAKTGGPRPCCSSLFLSVWASASNGCFARRRRRPAATSTGSLSETVNDRLRLVAAALRLCGRSGGGLCPRQHRPLPRARLAAAASRDVVRLSRRFSCHPDRERRRPFPAGPRTERFRIIPMDTAAARFWCRRLARVRRLVCLRLGDRRRAEHSRLSRWRHANSSPTRSASVSSRLRWKRFGAGPPRSDESGEAPSPVTRRFGRGAAKTRCCRSASCCCGCSGWRDAMASFWLVLVVITLPLAIGVTRRAVEHLLRPPGSPQAADGPPSVIAVCLERGIRALLIIGAVAVLAWGWGIDLVAPRAGRTHWFARLVARRVERRRHPARRRPPVARDQRRRSIASSPRPPTSVSRTPTRRGGGRGCARCCRFFAIFCSSSSSSSRR